MTFASGKQVNLVSGELKVNNALNNHWCETSLLSQAILKQVVSRDFIVKNLVPQDNAISFYQLTS